MSVNQIGLFFTKGIDSFISSKQLQVSGTVGAVYISYSVVSIIFRAFVQARHEETGDLMFQCDD